MVAITRYRGKRHKLKFATYDLEWIPHTYQERLVGVYEPGNYRCYPDTASFLTAELRNRNSGKVYFAHAGGMADIQFVLDTMIQRNNPHYSLKGHWSGSSLVIATIKRGKQYWSFVDSYWLLRDSLARIGKSIGLEKGGTEYFCSNYPYCGHENGDKPTCIFYAPIDILRDYNALDCMILHTAISRLEDEVWALGGFLRMTIASTALMLFRCAFLSKDIPISKALNQTCRDSYVASRVEVIERHCQKANYYDINSSFPWSMTKPQPGAFLGSSKTWRESDLAIVDAMVSIPDTAYIPPVPIRHNGRVFFPIGTFRRWFSSEDLRLILENGGRILKVYEVLHFKPFTCLRGYVISIYELRKRSTDPFQRIVYKYLMNSLYGKFGEGEDKQGLVINYQKKPKNVVQTYRPGVYKVEKQVDISHAHVPIAANITASSRALLTRHLIDSARQGRVYYCDTDSVVTDHTLQTGAELGAMKLEKEVDKATFLAPKLYRLHPGPEIRAKGFHRLTTAEFDLLQAGDPVTITRMVRVRENFAAGHFQPRDNEYLKRALSHLTPSQLEALGISSKRALIPKRATDESGKTRPWHIDEIREYAPHTSKS